MEQGNTEVRDTCLNCSEVLDLAIVLDGDEFCRTECAKAHHGVEEKSYGETMGAGGEVYRANHGVVGSYSQESSAPKTRKQREAQARNRQARLREGIA